jgi:hypothetical protein
MVRWLGWVAVVGCGSGASFVQHDDGTFTVRGRVLRDHPNCGGDLPEHPPEPTPAASEGVVIRHAARDAAGKIAPAGVAAEPITDRDGRFTVRVPAGLYCVQLRHPPLDPWGRPDVDPCRLTWQLSAGGAPPRDTELHTGNACPSPACDPGPCQDPA